MKKIFILFLLIQSVVAEKIYSQQYYPMIIDSATWNITTVNFGFYPWEQDTYYTNRYGIFGDTIIDSYLYKKVYLIHCYSEIFEPSSSTYFGAIREDSSKKVYFRLDSIESLQYDYSLNVGDTFHYTSTAFGPIDLTVESIDTVPINGENRRQIHLWPSQGWTSPWIEGIGSTASLIDYVYPWGNFALYLSCYFNNFTLIYGQPENCCLGITSVNEMKNEKMSFYPNPSNDVINIEFETNNNRKLEIYDYQSQLIEIINSNENIISFDIKEYHVGIYLMKIICDKDVTCMKFIKK